tara:strand:+ start:199 stop:300 length:102 start_codon:yes stop_codon:yes gene_type:complete
MDNFDYHAMKAREARELLHQKREERYQEKDKRR